MSDILLLFRLFGAVAPLEHLEHSIGHDESAEDVGRAEHHRNKAERVQQSGIRRAGDQHRAEHHDAVNGVRSRHERRMKHRWHARDHLETDEDRHDEDVDAEDKLLAHRLDSTRPGLELASRASVGACRIFPPAVMHTALMMSSSKLRIRSPLGASRVTSAATFFAYI